MLKVKIERLPTISPDKAFVGCVIEERIQINSELGDHEDNVDKHYYEILEDVGDSFLCDAGENKKREFLFEKRYFCEDYLQKFSSNYRVHRPGAITPKYVQYENKNNR